jgi:ElaB/YqjD/DUF883 family membrane-anchored ribosome-binding protein
MVSSDNRSETLQRDFNAVKADLGKIKTDTSVLARDAFKVGRSSAIEAKGHLQDTLRAATIRGKKGLSIARKQVASRPRTAVTAAFGVGLVLGLVLAGGRDRAA